MLQPTVTTTDQLLQKMMEIVASNVIDSQQSKRQPTFTPAYRAIYDIIWEFATYMMIKLWDIWC